MSIFQKEKHGEMNYNVKADQWPVPIKMKVIMSISGKL